MVGRSPKILKSKFPTSWAQWSQSISDHIEPTCQVGGVCGSGVVPDDEEAAPSDVRRRLASRHIFDSLTGAPQS